ncbi:hypothetical protein CDAR_217031 [Caerostris darwini]|uniref:Uncharacterized protein n=1 Tax=Caerostris darwini TaxID=1538125 RepID=A0AAV4UU90_9ARAC|nr:hypothetical protein CDAR_217031 [Caerostris darwini]
MCYSSKKRTFSVVGHSSEDVSKKMCQHSTSSTFPNGSLMENSPFPGESSISFPSDVESESSINNVVYNKQ